MTQPEPTTPPTPPAPPQDGPPAPPWGTDEQFDPGKAWNLIQNLRGDLEKKNGRIAELTPFEAKARELEDAQKTELQRATDALAAAQAEAAAHRTEALRLKVAAAKGVPAALVGRLQGSTEAELAADADSLLAAFPQAPAPPAGNPRVPVEALRPGALPNPPAPTLVEQIAAAEKAGNVRASIALKGQLLRQQAGGQ